MRRQHNEAQFGHPVVRRNVSGAGAADAAVDVNPWRKFTKRTMPKPGKSILLWMDLNHGGFPVSAYVDANGQITYCNVRGLQVLQQSDWRLCRWQHIIPPDEEKGQ